MLTQNTKKKRKPKNKIHKMKNDKKKRKRKQFQNAKLGKKAMQNECIMK